MMSPIIAEQTLPWRNEIVHGDCLEKMKELPDKSIDLILCDLPFGTTQNKWDSVIPLDLLWIQYERIIKDNGAIVLFAQTPFDKVLGVSNLKLLKYEWIWNKKLATGHLNAKKMPLKLHENILVFYKKLPTYNPQWWFSTPYDKGDTPFLDKSTNYGKQKVRIRPKSPDGKRYPVSILDISNANRKGKWHPTQKPVEVYEYLIQTYSNEGQIVLDNCSGAGTCAIASINTNRDFICMEMDDVYFEASQKRLKEHLSHKQKEQRTDTTAVVENM
jgi:site-specific DNA-methyltransferase (adenine-specific)